MDALLRNGTAVVTNSFQDGKCPRKKAAQVRYSRFFAKVCSLSQVQNKRGDETLLPGFQTFMYFIKCSKTDE